MSVIEGASDKPMVIEGGELLQMLIEEWNVDLTEHDVRGIEAEIVRATEGDGCPAKYKVTFRTTGPSLESRMMPFLRKLEV